MKAKPHTHSRLPRLLTALVAFPILATSLPAQLDPVKVFLLAGQSNMQGHARVEIDNGGVETIGTLRDVVTKNPTDYGHLVDGDPATGAWTVRDDVWIWVRQGSVGRPDNDRFDMGDLSVGFGAGTDRLGPELGFGNVLGDHFDEPVALVKTCWGGASLFYDFRSPSAVAKRGGEVGLYYNRMLSSYQDALVEIGNRFPGRDIELAGFAWHQGWNDLINTDASAEYEANMADFIIDVRAALNAPDLPFVIATSGMGEEPDYREVELAQLAMEPRENVTVVDTQPLWHPASESPVDDGTHWNEHGETLYLMGAQLGDAMEVLLTTPESDTTAPTPNPVTFETAPTALNSATVTMTASVASDVNSVEYYFTCTAGGGNDSGWQFGRTYTDTGLSPTTLYTYTVKARDKSAAENETTPSGGASITTPAVDTDPPSPNPPGFASAPAATGRASITMTAEVATDLYDVEYYFEETSGNPGGEDSGWQDSPSYVNDFLDPDTTYSYRVRARDKAATPNLTDWSDPVQATTAARDPGVVYWRRARNTAGAADVVTTGTLLEAKHAAGGDKDPSAPPVTVNTVTFQPGPILLVGRNDNVCKSDAPDEIEALLDNYGWGSGTFTLNGLVTGADYLVQVFLTDTRMPSPGDTQTLDDGSVPPYEVDLLSHPFGGFGQFTVGTFTADGPSKTLSIDRINAYQVRRLDSVDPGDDEAPDPSPMSWSSPPAAVGATSITMTAVDASDPSGVEYYFTCTSGGGHDSGWQDTPSYVDSGLVPGQTYSYTVKARDKSPAQNMTLESSPPASATTGTISTAGEIAWQAPRNTTVATDILTTGTLFKAQHASGPTKEPNPVPVTANTVTFGVGPIGTMTGNNSNTCDAAAPDELEALLDRYGWGGSGSFEVTGLTAGQEYLVQIFLCDMRVSAPGFIGEFGDGNGNTASVYCNPGDPGVYGQFVTGTFIAAASGTQTITVGGEGRINAYQVRSVAGGASDYDNWAANYPDADLTDSEGDHDGDGLTNDYERIWGLDPADPASVNPISSPGDLADGSFSYTRRDDDLSGLNYSVWYSTDLESWQEDTGVVQAPGTPDASGVETVVVTLSPALLGGSTLFTQVRSTE